MSTIDLYSQAASERGILVKAIKEQVDNGWGFVPLLGSGISAASGIPMGIDLRNYMIYSLYRSLKPKDHELSEKYRRSDPKANSAGSIKKPRIDLSRDGWPGPPLDSLMPQISWLIGIITIEALREIHGLHRNKNDTHLADCDDSIEAIKSYFDQMQAKESTSSAISKVVSLSKRLDCYRHGRSGEEKPIEEKYYELYDYIPKENPEAKDSDSEKYYRLIAEPIKQALEIWKDWVLTLNFLSCLEYSVHDGVHLGKSKSVVIDAFNRSITHDKRPNLAHIMLAHLAQPMRMTTILTTNFDSLTEKAFSNINRDLEVFDLSINGKLPSLDQIRRQESIIKLHGSNHETRADFSLNESPNLEENQKFASYFQIPTQAEFLASPRHLLVLGYSASDPRIVGFIRHSINQLSKYGFKIYWIYFSEGDRLNLHRKFPNQVGGPDTASKDKFPIIACRSHYPDLLLHEIYQGITHSLVPGGLPYPYLFNVPPNAFLQKGTIYHKEGDLQYFNETSKQIFQCLTANDPYPEAKQKTHAVLPVVVVPRQSKKEAIALKRVNPKQKRNDNPYYIIDGMHGVSSLASMTFEELVANRKKCLWLDLSHFRTPDSILTYALASISQSCGKYFSDHASLNPNHIRENANLLIHEYLKITPENWYLFINGRERPGSGIGWEPSENHPSRTINYNKLHGTFQLLANLGFRIVYLPYSDQKLSNLQASDRANSSTRKDTIYSSLSHRFRTLPESTHWEGTLTKIEQWLQEATKQPDIQEAQDSTIDAYSPKDFWFSKEERQSGQPPNDWNKLRFLYALSLFRNPRHYAALFSPCVFSCQHSFNMISFDNDAIRVSVVEGWLETFKATPLFRTMPGGFLWMHADIRTRLQNWLEDKDIWFRNSNAFRKLAHRKSWSHQMIAEWYDAAFRATHHGIPLAESLYHRVQSIRQAGSQLPWRERRLGLKVLSTTQKERELENAKSTLTDDEFKRRKAELENAKLEPSDFSPIESLEHAIIVRELLKCSELLELANPAVRLWMLPGLDEDLFGGNSDKKETHSGFVDFLEHAKLKRFTTDTEDKVSPNHGAIIRAIRVLEIQFRRIASVVNEQNDVGRRVYIGTQGQLRFYSHSHTPNDQPLANPKPENTEPSDNFIEISFTDRALYENELNLRMKIGNVLFKSQNFPNTVPDKNESETTIGKILVQFSALKDEDLPNRFESNYSEFLKEYQEAIGSYYFLNLESEPFAYRISSYNEDEIMRLIKLINCYLLNQVQLGKDEFFRGKKVKCERRFARLCSCVRIVYRLANWVGPTCTVELYEQLIDTCCLYSVALGRLNRFDEAKRHLDEASAYVRNTYTENKFVNLAKIELRRAEIALLRERHLRNTVERILNEKSYEEKQNEIRMRSQQLNSSQNEKSRILKFGRQTRAALIDESWIHLNWAHQYLKSCSRSTHWWGRLYFLRAWAISNSIRLEDEANQNLLNPDLPVRILVQANRDQKNLKNSFRINLRKAYLMQPDDGLRAIRLLHLNYKTYSRNEPIIEAQPGLQNGIIDDLLSSVRDWCLKKTQSEIFQPDGTILGDTKTWIGEWIEANKGDESLCDALLKGSTKTTE